MRWQQLGPYCSGCLPFGINRGILCFHVTSNQPYITLVALSRLGLKYPEKLSISTLADIQHRSDTTIMDKSLGENLHLWRFFKRAKQTVTREFIYTWSAPPPSPQPPTYNVGHVYTLFRQSFNIVWGGGVKVTQFKTDNSAFLKLRFENTEN